MIGDVIIIIIIRYDGIGESKIIAVMLIVKFNNIRWRERWRYGWCLIMFGDENGDG